MADPTAEFFSALRDRESEPNLRKASGSMRFDVVNGGRTERWLVTLDKGAIAVTRRNVRADCVVRADRAVFDRIATGETNAVAAVLREEVTVEGDVNLLVLFQRLFPAPPRKRGRRAGVTRRKR